MPNNTALRRGERFSQFFRDAGYMYTLSRIHNLLQRRIVSCNIIAPCPKWTHRRVRPISTAVRKHPLPSSPPPRIAFFFMHYCAKNFHLSLTSILLPSSLLFTFFHTY